MITAGSLTTSVGTMATVVGLGVVTTAGAGNDSAVACDEVGEGEGTLVRATAGSVVSTFSVNSR